MSGLLPVELGSIHRNPYFDLNASYAAIRRSIPDSDTYLTPGQPSTAGDTHSQAGSMGNAHACL